MKALKGALIAAGVGAVMAVMGTAPASATPIDFTWTPGAVGLTGGPIVNANNYNVTDFATITVDGSGNFTENGALNVTGFLNVGNAVASSGLGSTYSLYYVFTGTGNQGGPIPTTLGGIAAGGYSSLSYTLYAAPSTVSFTVGSGGVTVNSTGAFALATGALVPGAGNTVTLQDTASGLVPTSNVEVTMTPCTSASGACSGDESAFFTSPAASTAVLQFGNFSATGTVVTSAGNQVFINGGGGNITEALAPVPEPVTLSLFGAGLAGAAALRRRKAKKA